MAYRVFCVATYSIHRQNWTGVDAHEGICGRDRFSALRIGAELKDGHISVFVGQINLVVGDHRRGPKPRPAYREPNAACGLGIETLNQPRKIDGNHQSFVNDHARHRAVHYIFEFLSTLHELPDEAGIGIRDRPVPVSGLDRNDPPLGQRIAIAIDRQLGAVVPRFVASMQTRRPIPSPCIASCPEPI